MTRVAFLAEAQNHHPNWSNVYNTVTIELNTHDAGNIVTEKDHKLAKAIDKSEMSEEKTCSAFFLCLLRSVNLKTLP
jgi:pterin-4a-carbinolamine dehydratase